METVEPIRDPKKLECIRGWLLKHGHYRDYLLFVLGTNTGLRVSDLLNLRVGDIEGGYIRLREKKTRKYRKHSLNPQLVEMIQEYIHGKGDNEYLFPSLRNPDRPLDRHQAYRIINKAARACGITEKIGTHTLRKTYGYHFYKRYGDVAMLQEIFNHSSPSITLKYIGVKQDEIDEKTREFFI